MPVPTESIAVGRCYLTATKEIWRVQQIIDGTVTFTARDCKIGSERWGYRPERPLSAFASTVERQISCDFTLAAEARNYRPAG